MLSSLGTRRASSKSFSSVASSTSNKQKQTQKVDKKGTCELVSKKKRAEQAEGGESELGVGESVELPRHMGRGGGKQWCCLEWPLSEQPGFKAQENTVREYVKSQGHECIFLPKFHPGICCLSALSLPLLIFQLFGRPLLGC